MEVADGRDFGLWSWKLRGHETEKWQVGRGLDRGQEGFG